MKLMCIAQPGSGELETWGKSEVLCRYGNKVEVPDADGELMNGCKYWVRLPDEDKPQVEPADEETKPRGRKSKSVKDVDTHASSGDKSE